MWARCWSFVADCNAYAILGAFLTWCILCTGTALLFWLCLAALGRLYAWLDGIFPRLFG